jgi:hypothetical protein
VYAALKSASTCVKELPCGDTALTGGAIMLGTLVTPPWWIVVTFRCGAAGIGGVEGIDIKLLPKASDLNAIGGLPAIKPLSTMPALMSRSELDADDGES